MFLHGVAVQNQDPVADAILTHELAVNPLSVILICLRPLNDTGTLTEWQSNLTLIDAINRVTIRFRGSSIISMTGRDAAAMAYFRRGVMPLQNNHQTLTNARRIVVLPIFMGRRPYDPRYCFPASRSGELTIELDVDVAATGYDDLQYTIETIELLGAKPQEYERTVQIARTNSAVGLNDMDFPVGNLVRGALLFGTTPHTGTTPVPSWGRISTIADGVQVGYAGTDFEVAHMLGSLLGRQPPSFDDHAHLVDATQADADELTHTGPLEVGSGGWANYAYLDFDPLGDDSHAIDTTGLSRFQIRADVETADAVRMIPVERVKV